MALKIKLSRLGAKKRPIYRIIVAEARSKREGKSVDLLGSYNPLTSPPTLEIDQAKLEDWLAKGAKPTNSVRKILETKDERFA